MHQGLYHPSHLLNILLMSSRTMPALAISSLAALVSFGFMMLGNLTARTWNLDFLLPDSCHLITSMMPMYRFAFVVYGGNMSLFRSSMTASMSTHPPSSHLKALPRQLPILSIGHEIAGLLGLS